MIWLLPLFLCDVFPCIMWFPLLKEVSHWALVPTTKTLTLTLTLVAPLSSYVYYYNPNPNPNHVPDLISGMAGHSGVWWSSTEFPDGVSGHAYIIMFPNSYVNDLLNLQGPNRQWYCGWCGLWCKGHGRTLGCVVVFNWISRRSVRTCLHNHVPPFIPRWHHGPVPWWHSWTSIWALILIMCLIWSVAWPDTRVCGGPQLNFLMGCPAMLT